MGSIVPHHIPGFSGGGKIVQPGISGEATTAYTHLLSVRAPRSYLGILDNPVREEMDEIAKGGHSEKEFRQIIAKAKSINPALPIWAPCYPPKELERSFDYDIDAIIFSFYNTKVLQDHARLLDQGLKKFEGKPLMGSVYLNAGSEGRWLTEQEYKQLLNFFVQDINEGKLCGLRIFRVENLQQRPEYAAWAKEALANLKVR